MPRQVRCAMIATSRAVIDLELLNALRGLSLPIAARTVGISATAFKKACRRLGLTRWQYRRGPGRSGHKRGAIPTRAAGDEIDAELAGMDGVEWEENGLADWLGGGFSEAGGAYGPAGDGDDALVLEMLARPWPLNIDKYANSCCP